MITVKWINFGTTLNCALIHVLTQVSWEFCAFSNRSGFHGAWGQQTNLLRIAFSVSVSLIVIIEFSC